MYLIDTNIFLEVLLSQQKKKICKDFLDINANFLHISDFSLHSIGIILFIHGKENIFQRFLDDIMPKVEIITLPKQTYSDLVDLKKKLGLDFDDAYQFKIAKEYNLKIVTMDKDFEKIEDRTNIIFL